MKRSRIDEDRFSALVAKKNFEKMRGIWRKRSHFARSHPGLCIVFGQVTQIKPAEHQHCLSFHA